MGSITVDEPPSSSDGIGDFEKKQEFLFCFTEFLNLNATSKKTTRGTWGELVDRVKNPKTYARKSDMPLISCATYGDKVGADKLIDGALVGSTCLRNAENVGLVYAIEIDHDGGKVPEDQAAAMLEAAGIEAVIHTTPSHRDDCPRWRAIVPLSKPCSPLERALHVATVNAALGGIAAPESFVLSQSFYIGRVEGTPYEWRHVKGAPVDDGPHLFLTPDYGHVPSGNKSDGSTSTDDIPEMVSVDTLKDIELAVRALTIDRANDYVLWVAVLLHLRHLAGYGHPEIAEKLARGFSQRSEKFNELEFNKKWQGLPLNKGHFKTIFDLATSDGWVNPRKGAIGDDTATSDVANARRLAKLLAGRCVFVHGSYGWGIYSTGLYSPCSRGEHIEAAKGLGSLILSEANSSDPERIKKTIAQATRAMSATGITAALLLAQSDPQIAIDPTGMDEDPDLLNTENCIVHLPTGKSIPHDPAIVMARQCSAPYFPDATCPIFDEFMLAVSCNDPDWVNYLQRLVGYTICGRVNEELIIFLLGWGANGKSVFSNVIRRILNSYASSVPANFLMVSTRDGEAATPSLARLPGVRLAQANEVEAGARLSAQAVKVAASSDAIAARHLHKAAFEFTPTHTLWVRGNHKPIITDTDDGIWRRIRLIPWDRQFGPDEKDVHLEEKLMQEATGILAWMVRGHREYLDKGLTPAKRVADASSVYRNESDIVAQWINERTDRRDSIQCPQSDAYNDYRDWCIGQGLQRPMTKRSFTLSLSERGFESSQESTGARRRMYVGFQTVNAIF